MAKKDKAPQEPRRWTPKQAQGVIGRLWILSMLLVMAAIAIKSVALLAPAFLLWIVMLVILFKYWRCPKCGKWLGRDSGGSFCKHCGTAIDTGKKD